MKSVGHARLIRRLITPDILDKRHVRGEEREQRAWCLWLLDHGCAHLAVAQAAGLSKWAVADTSYIKDLRATRPPEPLIQKINAIELLRAFGVKQ